MRVRPKRRAVLTARLEGAPTAATMGMPAMTAFCTSSKLVRPLSMSTWPESGRCLFKKARPTELIDGVVAADIFTHEQEFAGGAEKTAGVETAGAIEDLLRLAQLIGQRADDGFGNARDIARKNGTARGFDGFDGGLAADSAA